MQDSPLIINKKNVLNIIKIAIISAISLGVSIFSGFIIPKILSPISYGYYQTGLLYATYLGIVPLGFLDGIILTYAGKKEEELPIYKFRFYWIVMLFLHLIVSGIFITIAFSAFSGPERWILAYLGVQLFFGNLTSFFSNISTLTSNFKTYNKISFTGTLLRFTILILITLILIYKKEWLNDFPFYIALAISLCPTIIMFFLYLFRYRAITIDKIEKTIFNKKCESTHLIKIGLPLLISNLVILLILENDRQFVQIAYDIETYAIYAFAYSLLSMISKVLISISVVLFPELKKLDKKSVNDQYPSLIGTLCVIVSFLTLGFFAVKGVVSSWLTSYIDSLKIFRVILSSYILYSSSVIINQNFYKTHQKNVYFMISSAISLVLAVGFNLFAHFVFHSTLSISVATLFALLFWFLSTSIPLSKSVQFKDWNNYLYIIIYIIGFNLFALIPYFWVDVLLSCSLFLLLSILLQRKSISRLLNVFKKNK